MMTADAKNRFRLAAAASQKRRTIAPAKARSRDRRRAATHHLTVDVKVEAQRFTHCPALREQFPLKQAHAALLRKFLRSYSFITQMVALGDRELHEAFVYGGFLVKKLHYHCGFGILEKAPVMK